MKTMGIEVFENLLADIGRAAEIDNLKPDDSGFCSIDVDGIVCNMQYIFDSHALYVFSELGQIPEKSLEKVAPDLLSANLFGIETGGGVLSLEKESRQLIFSYQVSLENMDHARFEKILENCVNYMELWKNKLADMIRQIPEGDDALDHYRYTQIRG